MTLKMRMEKFLPLIVDKDDEKGEHTILNEYKSNSFYIFDLALNMRNNPIKHLNLCFETYNDNNIWFYILAPNNEELYLESLVYVNALINDFRKFHFSFLSANQDFENIKKEFNLKLEEPVEIMKI